MSESPMRYTFWLMPAEPLKMQLHSVVRKLAREFDGPEFDPHVTIYYGPSNPTEAEAITKKLAEGFSPLDLRMRYLDQSEVYEKTVFIQFDPSETLNRMRNLINDSLAMPTGYVLNPHLSLLYKDISEAKRRELCSQPIAPEGLQHFDGVRVVEFEPPWRPEAIRKSRILADLKLQGAKL